ncbi:MAG: PAS domain-containing protein [Acidobacteria bacterium]|nr:PAS domain-containing protein [Acidobacteriota bacterium]
MSLLEPQAEPASADRPSAEGAQAPPPPLAEASLDRRIFNAFPVMAMILDGDRRIVLANRALAEFAGAASTEELCGKRPGDVLGCAHAAETPDGCGTTESCAICGGKAGIRNAQLGSAGAEAWRIRRRAPHGEEVLELRPWAMPLEIGEQRFVMVCVQDAGDRLRRNALERSFFQVAAPLADGIERLLRNLGRSQRPDQQQAAVQAIAVLARELAEVIHSHKDLAAAERGDLQVRAGTLSTTALLSDLLRQHAHRPVAADRRIETSPEAEEVSFTSDPALVRRIMEHMLENALEACEPGDTVTVGCRRSGDFVEFSVRNPGQMPKDVQLQVFQRAYTTKGPGRGLGAYMMKLLSEQYLGGSVAFRSSAAEGTVFTARFPLQDGKG